MTRPTLLARVRELFPLDVATAAELGIREEQTPRGREVLRRLAEIEAVEDPTQALQEEAAELREELRGWVEEERRRRVFGELPYWGAEEVRLLWHSDYYDGPLTGVLERGGRRYAFSMVADYDGSERRAYLALELTAEEMAEEESWHALFRQWVGTHTDYPRDGGRVHPAEMHHHFYDLYRKAPRRDWSQAPIAAWFEY